MCFSFGDNKRENILEVFTSFHSPIFKKSKKMKLVFVALAFFAVSLACDDLNANTNEDETLLSSEINITKIYEMVMDLQMDVTALRVHQSRVDVTLTEHDGRILQNKENINTNEEQTQVALTSLLQEFEDSSLTFEAETSIGDQLSPNSNVTYLRKTVDTHNALDNNTGIFTAPFDGSYAFSFKGIYKCDTQLRWLKLVHNELQIDLFYCYKKETAELTTHTSLHVLELAQGDEVYISTGNSIIQNYHPAKFMGYLIRKSK